MLFDTFLLHVKKRLRSPYTVNCIPRHILYSTSSKTVDKYSTLKDGDTVMLSSSRGKRKYLLKLSKNSVFSTTNGDCSHADILNAGLGGRIFGKKTVFRVFKPSLDDFILLGLNRATTPIYPKDAAAVMSLLDISSGCRVLEAGCGSGGMTLKLWNAVGDAGVVCSFDTHLDRLQLAASNMKSWLKIKGDMSTTIDMKRIANNNPDMFRVTKNTMFCRGDVGDLVWLSPSSYFDAVFLDMQDPLSSALSIHKMLKPGRPLVVLLPNITQCVDFVRGLNNNAASSFYFQRMMEVTYRDWDIRPASSHKEWNAAESHGMIEAVTETNSKGSGRYADRNYTARPSFQQESHTAFLCQFIKMEI